LRPTCLLTPILLITFLKFFWRFQKILGRRRDDLVARRRRSLKARSAARFSARIQHSFCVRAEAAERTLLFCNVNSDRLAARANERKGSRPNASEARRGVREPPRILYFPTRDGATTRNECTFFSWRAWFRRAKTVMLLRRTPRNR